MVCGERSISWPLVCTVCLLILACRFLPCLVCCLLAGEAAGGVSRPTLVLYPMKCPNRAAERRPEVIQVLRQAGYDRVIDMSGHEKRDKSYFEGTGGKGLCICIGCGVRWLRCDRG
jgi:hypothetical protein